MRAGEGLPNDERAAARQCFAALQFTAFRSLLLALTLLLSGPLFAADLTCTQPAATKTPDTEKKGRLDELDEVVVTDEQGKTDTKDLQAWLRLLVGQYTYEGYVDLCGKGNATDQRPVTGNADCIGSGSTPNVQCTVNVRWPVATAESAAPVLGEVSNLLPAFVIYSLENRHSETDPRALALLRANSPDAVSSISRSPFNSQTPDGIAAAADARLQGQRQVMKEFQTSHWGLMFMQVDNRGVGEWASGTLVGDTFTSRERCVGIPGACRKLTRITAKPDSNEISMLVDIEIDNQRVLRQAFLLHRESSTRKSGQAGESP